MEENLNRIITYLNETYNQICVLSLNGDSVDHAYQAKQALRAAYRAAEELQNLLSEKEGAK